MPTKNFIALCLLSFSTLTCCTQTNEKPNWNVEVDTIEDSNYYLYREMGDSLYDTIEGRVVEVSNRVIKTEEEALDLGRQCFAKEYGKDYNLDTRRYLVHFVKGYWVVKGLQPVGYTGGTLVAAFDSESGELFSTLYWK